MSVVLSSFRARLEAAERDLTVEALQATHGAVKPAARLCGLHPCILFRNIRRFNLKHLVSRHSARAGNAAWRALGD